MAFSQHIFHHGKSLFLCIRSSSIIVMGLPQNWPDTISSHPGFLLPKFDFQQQNQCAGSVVDVSSDKDVFLQQSQFRDLLCLLPKFEAFSRHTSSCGTLMSKAEILLAPMTF
jgi:isopentenyldiphosphate isomerase